MKFRTFDQDPWSDWDPRWLREVARNASMVAVRITGFAIRDRAQRVTYDPGESKILAWEDSVKQIVGKRRMAFALLQMKHHASGESVRRGMRMDYGNELYESWARTLTLRHRFDYMLRLLRAEIQKPVLVHVEDFAARWVLESGFRPDIWIMDNPMIGRDESSDRWSYQLERIGYLRHSRWARMRHFDRWKLHIKRNELIASHLPVNGEMGVWPRDPGKQQLVPITRQVLLGAECQSALGAHEDSR